MHDRRDQKVPTLTRLDRVGQSSFVIKGLIATAPLLLGLGTLFAGFMYSVLFAGIPYQDPPPALQADYEFHIAVASRIEAIGLFVIALGMLWLLANGLYHAVRMKTNSASSGE